MADSQGSPLIDFGDGMFSFFDESCRRAGLDPAKERAKMKARESRRNYEPCPHYSLEPKAAKPQVSHTSPPNHTPTIVTVRSAGEEMPNFKSKEELRAFLVDLLMDDIVEICLGTMQRKS